MHVVVIVLGDIGRSPRMQYHTLSLLKEGYDVSLVGYTGEELVPDLVGSSLCERLDVIRFETFSPRILRKIPPFYYIWRLINLISMITYTLFIRVRRPVDFVLVQNPPAIPLLFVSFIYCKFLGLLSRQRKRSKLIIDWHNLGYTMLSPGYTQKLAKVYEQAMAPLADGHFCVTSAMKEFLINDMKIMKEKILVLYDCPPSMFKPLNLQEQHEFFLRIQESLNCRWGKDMLETQTLFTESRDGQILSRINRPVLVTSSTSWTADEDFSILLDALITLDKHLGTLRMVICVTGKGPMKEFYEEKISRLQLQQISIHTLWLEPGDYPRLLACADVGVSLHTSTSGLDLPMKVLDLFGCQTPVCAIDFECLSELVKDDINGRVFNSSDELADQLYSLLIPICQSKQHSPQPHSFGKLATYSANLVDRPRWDENWTVNALPLFKKI